VPNPEILEKVIQTLRPYLRSPRNAHGEQWREELELWLDVEREVTANDQRMRAVDKENWLAGLDVLEREFLPANSPDFTG